MDTTLLKLLYWNAGPTNGERICRDILFLEGYTEIVPQSPMGGPDGKKDILCSRAGKRFVVACYFPVGQKDKNDIKRKFKKDFAGAFENKADGFIFMTNQLFSPTPPKEFSTGHSIEIQIFNGERIAGILDSPFGIGLRAKYLKLKPTSSELHSSTHLELKDIKDTLKIFFELWLESKFER